MPRRPASAASFGSCRSAALIAVLPGAARGPDRLAAHRPRGHGHDGLPPAARGAGHHPLPRGDHRRRELHDQVFRRLKILTDAGRAYSNIEIPFTTGATKIIGIQARVVPPNGPAREFGGQVFDKTAFRYRKLRVAVKTLALPDVAVGSIIDFRYKVEPDCSDSGSTKGLEDIVVGLSGLRDRPEEGGIRRVAWRSLPSSAGRSRRNCSPEGHVTRLHPMIGC